LQADIACGRGTSPEEPRDPKVSPTLVHTPSQQAKRRKESMNSTPSRLKKKKFQAMERRVVELETENRRLKEKPQEAAVTSESATRASDDCCEVCLINRKDPRTALVPCGHQRFCKSCAETVHQHGDRCPLCRADITMLLRLY